MRRIAQHHSEKTRREHSVSSSVSAVNLRFMGTYYCDGRENINYSNRINQKVITPDSLPWTLILYLSESALRGTKVNEPRVTSHDEDVVTLLVV